MRRHYPEIEACGGTVIGVSFESRDRLFQLSRQMQLPFQLLSDPERDTYRAYGVHRGNLWRMFGPGTIWAYIKALSRGNSYHFARSDLQQLGGDFVIDAAGIVRYEHHGATPHDRPTVDQLLAVLNTI